MNSEILLEEFENLAERLSITIKYGRLDGEGGLCRYKEDYHIVVNKRLETDGRIAVIARAFSQFPLEDVFLVPAIREAIDLHQAEAVQEEAPEPENNEPETP